MSITAFNASNVVCFSSNVFALLASFNLFCKFVFTWSNSNFNWAILCLSCSSSFFKACNLWFAAASLVFNSCFNALALFSSSVYSIPFASFSEAVTFSIAFFISSIADLTSAIVNWWSSNFFIAASAKAFAVSKFALAVARSCSIWVFNCSNCCFFLLTSVNLLSNASYSTWYLALFSSIWVLKVFAFSIIGLTSKRISLAFSKLWVLVNASSIFVIAVLNLVVCSLILTFNASRFFCSTSSILFFKVDCLFSASSIFCSSSCFASFKLASPACFAASLASSIALSKSFLASFNFSKSSPFKASSTFSVAFLRSSLALIIASRALVSFCSKSCNFALASSNLVLASSILLLKLLASVANLGSSLTLSYNSSAFSIAFL